MTDLAWLHARHLTSLAAERRATSPESAHAHRALAAHYTRRAQLGLIDEHLSLD